MVLLVILCESLNFIIIMYHLEQKSHEFIRSVVKVKVKKKNNNNLQRFTSHNHPGE
jgi:hypothetical protein